MTLPGQAEAAPAARLEAAVVGEALQPAADLSGDDADEVGIDRHPPDVVKLSLGLLAVMGRTFLWRG